MSIARHNGGKIVQFHVQGNTVATVDGDGRQVPRQRTLKAGVVAYNDRHSTLPCTVRDLSPTGARVKVDGSVSAPDTFELIIEMDGLEASCEVVWRKDREVGVRFLAAPRIVAAKRTQVVDPLLPSGKPSLRRKPKGGGSV